jgi:hypothetical protein
MVCARASQSSRCPPGSLGNVCRRSPRHRKACRDPQFRLAFLTLRRTLPGGGQQQGSKRPRAVAAARGRTEPFGSARFGGPTLSLPKPWYRKSKKAWYLQVSRGTQKRLGKTRREAEQHPEGPLFRSTRRRGGARRPWSGNGLRCRFKRLREKVARLREREHDPERRKKIPDLSGVTAYVLRHTYTTHALTSGLPVPVVSALLGHKSMKMVDEHYNHTGQATGLLKEAVAKAAQKERPPTCGGA